MTRLPAFLAALVLLAACAPEAPPGAPQDATGVDLLPLEPMTVLAAGPPPGGWPELGGISGTLGRDARAWTTYDFSVGAYDASAWIRQGDDGAPVLTLIGYPPGDYDARDGLIRIEARLSGPVASGAMIATASASIVDGRDWAAPRLTDAAARVTIDDLTRENEPGQSGYGAISGTVGARLCPPAGGACSELALRFDTELQFDGL